MNKILLITSLVFTLTYALLHELSIHLTFPSSTIQIESPSSPIIISFNHNPFFYRLISISANPSILLDLKKNNQSNNYAIIPKKNSIYQSGQSYLLSITYFGKKIGEIDLRSQKDVVSAGTAQNELTIAQDYPLAQYLPYKSTDLIVEYLAPKKLKLSTTLSSKDAIKKIKDYSEELYVNIDDHEFMVESN